MDQFFRVVDSLTPEIYERLKRAVETGKWPNGESLTGTQRETALRAVLAWNRKHAAEDGDRIGEIPAPEHTHCGSGSDESEWQPLTLMGATDKKKGS